jgi:uncharacterized protein YciI
MPPAQWAITTRSILRKRFVNYLVIAKDKPGVLEKRMQCRDAHLERAKISKERGFILLGGATLSERNEMNGSMLIFDAASKEEVEEYMSTDPYTVGGVWDTWTTEPFKLAAVSKKLIN